MQRQQGEEKVTDPYGYFVGDNLVRIKTDTKKLSVKLRKEAVNRKLVQRIRGGEIMGLLLQKKKKSNKESSFLFAK